VCHKSQTRVNGIVTGQGHVLLGATRDVYWVTSVGGLNVSGVGTVPAQHVRLRDPVTRDRFIIGHVTDIFKRER